MDPIMYARYRRTQLAKKMNVTLWFIRGMVAAGFKMPRKTATLKEAQEWLLAHPDFSPTQAIEARAKQLNVTRDLSGELAV